MGKGIVEDVSKVTASIAASVRAAQQMGQRKIDRATVGIAGAHIACLNSRGTVALPNIQRAITQEDVSRALEGARTVAIPNNRDILHAIPRFYIIDGEQSNGDPVGKFGHRLDVEAHVVTGALTVIQNLTKCVEEAGVAVDGLVLEPVAAADAVLDEEERSHGVILADIGGGTTDIAIFVEGSVLHTAVLPVGGNHITNDVVYGLRIPFSSADAAKELYGHAVPAQVAADETVEVDSFGTERRRLVNRRRLCEIVQARVDEILEMIRDEVSRVGYEEMISAGIVLTGGTSNLAGIVAEAERILQMPARVGSPSGVYNLDETLENPAFSTSIGLLGWAARVHDAVLGPAKAQRAARSGRGVLRRVTGLAHLFMTD
jgi:cell division protein FtsA